MVASSLITLARSWASLVGDMACRHCCSTVISHVLHPATLAKVGHARSVGAVGTAPVRTTVVSFIGAAGPVCLMGYE